MSDAGVLNPILLRSTTPGPNEKVLNYLESMNLAGQQLDVHSPARSIVDGDDHDEPVRRPVFSPTHSQSLRDFMGSPLSYGAGRTLIQALHDDDDGDSTAQNGQRSEFGGLHPEPGPNDAPGPHYPSYDSGPSFGNLGPEALSTFNNVMMSTWTPSWGQPVDKPVPDIPQPTPGTAQMPLPDSAASVEIQVQSPSSPRSRAVQSNGGKAPSEQPPPKPESRPLSPLSARSRVTKMTEKGTAYPPLPESRMGDDDSSPTHSKAAKQRPGELSPRSSHKNIATPARSTFSGNGAHRPFSPYRHAATTEDLLHAAIRGRAIVLPEATAPPPKAPSAAASQRSSPKKADSVAQSQRAGSVADFGIERAPSELNQEEARIVQDTLARTPRTSHYTPSALGSDIMNSHYHDGELCILLHEVDSATHEVVKKTLRKAIRQRVKKLGMKYDNESIKQYRRMHDHDPSVHLGPDDLNEDVPPKWAADIKRELVLMQQRIESLGPKIEGLKAASQIEGSGYEDGGVDEIPATRTINIHTEPTGTLAESVYHHPETEVIIDEEGSDDGTEMPPQPPMRTESDMVSQRNPGRDDSPGQRYLEEEFYKLRQKPHGTNSHRSHNTWELAREDEQEFDEDEHEHGPSPTGLQTIPDRDSNAGETIPAHDNPATWNNPADISHDSQVQLPPWQRIHQRLLSWAIIWPLTDFDTALNSTTRGQQVNEVALTIWSTQTYKRYVRAKLTESPQGVVDRLFVPPNMADAISNAVFNGRHGDACGMLRDLWSPFGLDGMPRLLVVLAKHRSDPNHWVVHRFNLPEGSLTTYDSYPERTLPDGRPLGWWFAIRVAWPNTMYPSPDHLMQKMVRLHRPMQLPVDNSVAACGLWRNILMGSRAERSLDLERLRDLINTEVKNLRQKKQIGKLSVGAPRPVWDLH
ncbi:hypothetical protein MIND_00089500 [Mycena indigotica]|uniref:Uncharacterized protein n=1 Tax=Mycena indigotica TaxID=2126181 RepID=A0A8H6WGD5_9AGAR|nr:uncharacterized protein MIND_00089500 [Mycena indigotica]KAF7315736.1 hypothetical protein MIND_00089500 [Mycena indigotica]